MSTVVLVFMAGEDLRCGDGLKLRLEDGKLWRFDARRDTPPHDAVAWKDYAAGEQVEVFVQIGIEP